MENLHRIIESESRYRFVFLMFTAKWCGPCKKQYPVMKKWAQSNRDKVHVILVDADRHPDLITLYDVRGVPTIKIIRDSRILWSTSGFQSKGSLKKLLKQSEKQWK